MYIFCINLEKHFLNIGLNLSLSLFCYKLYGIIGYLRLLFVAISIFVAHVMLCVMPLHLLFMKLALTWPKHSCTCSI